MIWTYGLKVAMTVHAKGSICRCEARPAEIHFPEVKAGQALISGIAIASANQELKPSVFPASGLKASELFSTADRNWAAPDWSWAAADKELLVKTPKELLPEDKNARASVAYEAETASVKVLYEEGASQTDGRLLWRRKEEQHRVECFYRIGPNLRSPV